MIRGMGVKTKDVKINESQLAPGSYNIMKLFLIHSLTLMCIKVLKIIPYNKIDKIT